MPEEERTRTRREGRVRSGRTDKKKAEQAGHRRPVDEPKCRTISGFELTKMETHPAEDLSRGASVESARRRRALAKCRRRSAPDLGEDLDGGFSFRWAGCAPCARNHPFRASTEHRDVSFDSFPGGSPRADGGGILNSDSPNARDQPPDRRPADRST